MKHNTFSDLRKPGLVPGESLSLSKKYEFCFRETLIYKRNKRFIGTLLGSLASGVIGLAFEGNIKFSTS